ncbi:WND domain-containing WiSP protein [Tropheryma whipplei]|uniref:WND domain-containing WiSP protein n=1 Tax=Tropheryma whipplei TaxID=2039 RepID=UPI0011D0D3AB|nr:WND domain-containing WiSP protein [Tropheryma whipplei]
MNGKILGSVTPCRVLARVALLLLLSSLQYETAFARQTPPALSLLSSVSSTSVSSNTKYTRVSNTNTQEVCVTTNTNVSLLIDPVTSSTKQTLSCTPSLSPQPQTHIYVPYTDTSSYLYVPYITNTHISLYYTDKKADPSSFLTFPHTDIATPYGDEKVISITKTTTNLIALLTTRNIFFFDIHVTEKPKITVPIHKQIDNTYLSDIPSLRNSRYTFSLTHPNKDITIDRYTGQIHLSSLPTSPITAIAINKDTSTHITYAIDTQYRQIHLDPPKKPRKRDVTPVTNTGVCAAQTYSPTYATESLEDMAIRVTNPSWKASSYISSSYTWSVPPDTTAPIPPSPCGPTKKWSPGDWTPTWVTHPTPVDSYATESLEDMIRKFKSQLESPTKKSFSAITGKTFDTKPLLRGGAYFPTSSKTVGFSTTVWITAPLSSIDLNVPLTNGIQTNVFVYLVSGTFTYTFPTIGAFFTTTPSKGTIRIAWVLPAYDPTWHVPFTTGGMYAIFDGSSATFRDLLNAYSSLSASFTTDTTFYASNSGDITVTVPLTNGIQTNVFVHLSSGGLSTVVPLMTAYLTASSEISKGTIAAAWAAPAYDPTWHVPFTTADLYATYDGPTGELVGVFYTPYTINRTVSRGQTVSLSPLPTGTYSFPTYVSYATKPGTNRVPAYLFMNPTNGALVGSVYPYVAQGQYQFPVAGAVYNLHVTGKNKRPKREAAAPCSPTKKWSPGDWTPTWVTHPAPVNSYATESLEDMIRKFKESLKAAS